MLRALGESRGTLLWRFSTGEPLVEPAVVVDTRVFAAMEPGGMYCLDAKMGQELWWTPGVTEFIAASRDRLYVVDRIGQMRVLDIKTGTRLDTIPYPKRAVRMYNDQTDRIYLVKRDGASPVPPRNGKRRTDRAQRAGGG